jgi:hypothetical protein
LLAQHVGKINDAQELRKLYSNFHAKIRTSDTSGKNVDGQISGIFNKAFDRVGSASTTHTLQALGGLREAFDKHYHTTHTAGGDRTAPLPDIDDDLLNKCREGFTEESIKHLDNARLLELGALLALFKEKLPEDDYKKFKNALPLEVEEYCYTMEDITTDGAFEFEKNINHVLNVFCKEKEPAKTEKESFALINLMKYGGVSREKIEENISPSLFQAMEENWSK